MVRQRIASHATVNPRETPAYSLPEAAHYLRIPRATLRSWVRGRYYPTESGRRFFEPIITLPERETLTLSFVNLIEAHVLSAIRKDHNVALPSVRRALEYVGRRFAVRRPLADQRFETDGVDLFVERFGQLINASREGQLALRDLLQQRLRRIERDRQGNAVRLYPFTRKDVAEQPKVIVIDPDIAFGRPVLVGTGIVTAIIAERYKAGESIEGLAADYERPRLEIEEAIRCELQLEAA